MAGQKASGGANLGFEQKMKRLTAELSEQMREGKKLDEEIKNNLNSLGWNI